MKKSIFLALTLALCLTACQEGQSDFLTRYPQGGSISKDQYDQLSDRLEGSVRGLYVKLYTMGGSSHDEFGKRSIDLWGDLLCGDIALTGKTYGWLYTDEQMLTVNRTGTIWGHYYSLLHNINITIKDLRNDYQLIQHIEEYGFPSDSTCTYEYTSEEKDLAINYAQLVGMRGYIYAQLAKWYTPVEGCTYMKGYTIDDYKCCPVYDEFNVDVAQPQSTSAEVYNQAFRDLELGIRLYEEFGQNFMREHKLIMDREVLCGLAAQAYLNRSAYASTLQVHMDSMALINAKKVIESGKYQMIDSSNVLTNGFNDVENKSWIWGQNVTVETAGGLKSWFGQVDIHSYSYAWAGDTKVIDIDLFSTIPTWDIRKQWFNDGSKNSVYKLCPDKKFFSASNPTSTQDNDLDRDWLSDNVFLRYESMYLVAAEAEYRLNNMSKAREYLLEVVNRRKDISSFAKKTEFGVFEDEINSPDGLKKWIIYNWQIEMWGEGYGLETFRRWAITGRKRGSNHDYNKGGTMNATDDNMNMNIPSSETTYNPNIKTSSL